MSATINAMPEATEERLSAIAFGMTVLTPNQKIGTSDRKIGTVVSHPSHDESGEETVLVMTEYIGSHLRGCRMYFTADLTIIPDSTEAISRAWAACLGLEVSDDPVASMEEYVQEMRSAIFGS